MESTVLFKIEKGRIQYQNKQLFQDLDFTIRVGETWAIAGDSGSGKTSLLKALAGQLPITGGRWEAAFFEPLKKNGNLPADPLFSWRNLVAFVDARHRFTNLSHTNTFYYQQRYNSCDAEDAPTVAELLEQEGRNPALFGWNAENVIATCQLDKLLDKQVILLSNGETRRLLTGLALLKNPALLLLDNPTSGLDKEKRIEFEQLLARIIASGIHVVLSLSHHELPASITHIAQLKNGQIQSISNRQQYHQVIELNTAEYNAPQQLDAWLKMGHVPEFEEIVEIQNGRVQYGNRIILEDINWKIRKAERWSISGHNGAGKSTLISLITGDNPQAYANNIKLFGKKRGSGESIWEIKKKIGFVSPELFQYFPQETTVAHAVESGLYDTIGLYRPPAAENAMLIQTVLHALGINDYATNRLQLVATSVQRLALVARALVKYPPLLILDEPCQGLDHNQTEQFKNLMEELCRQTSISLIYVSHYADEIPAAVNRQLVLANGKMVTLQHS
ncbi:MAG: ATP-binding cassette domain-containing protein [Flavipsychrobacter sp.]|jgi:molybdate transport system ATP-binding protein|nr:ATP-binding cassette domain-containing protein [Flavipsychrobacter sp.]